jgi:hypothetical protein
VNLTHRPLYPQDKSHYRCWIVCSEGLSVSLYILIKGDLFSAYRESKHDCSGVYPVPQLLYELSYPH